MDILVNTKGQKLGNLLLNPEWLQHLIICKLFSCFVGIPTIADPSIILSRLLKLVI